MGVTRDELFCKCKKTGHDAGQRIEENRENRGGKRKIQKAKVGLLGNSLIKKGRTGVT